MKNNFSIVTGPNVRKILLENTLHIYEVIKKTYLAHENGKTSMPPSCFLRFPNNPQARIIALPAFVSDQTDIAGIKWISSNPGNHAVGLPRASAVMILNDAETGRPFACLEGSHISIARTAASAVLGAEYISHFNKNIENLGIVGNGPISAEIYRYFVDTKWNIKNVTLFDKEISTSKKFLEKNNVLNDRKFYISNSFEELASSCDVVVFATTASEPYLLDYKLIENCAVILNISLRDISPEVLLKCHNVVDDIEHVLNANTSPHLAQKLCGNIEFINGTIGELIAGSLRLDNKKPVIYSPMGLGVLDLNVAKFVFDISLATQQKVDIVDFF